MMMSEIILAGSEPFWSAELDYRRERAQRTFKEATGGRRRHRVRRRPTLKLPHVRRRPVAVA
jgi:hypothetical protein